MGLPLRWNSIETGLPPLPRMTSWKRTVAWIGWPPALWIRSPCWSPTFWAGMPAQKVGLQQGDLIQSAGGHPIHATVRFHEVIRGSGGKPVSIEFQRNGKPMQVTVQPVWSGADGPARWVIGAYVEPKLNIVTSRLSLPNALRQSVGE